MREREFEQRRTMIKNQQKVLPLSPLRKGPSLFKKSAERIDQERQKFQDERRMSTFKPAFFKNEDEDAFFSFNVKNIVKNQWK